MRPISISTYSRLSSLLITFSTIKISIYHWLRSSRGTIPEGTTIYITTSSEYMRDSDGLLIISMSIDIWGTSSIKLQTESKRTTSKNSEKPPSGFLTEIRRNFIISRTSIQTKLEVRYKSIRSELTLLIGEAKTYCTNWSKDKLAITLVKKDLKRTTISHWLLCFLMKIRQRRMILPKKSIEKMN